MRWGPLHSIGRTPYVSPRPRDGPLISGSLERMPIWREVDHAPIDREAALGAWARTARSLLIEVAKRYHATVTYSTLAERVQETSGIRTDQLFRGWINRVLYLASELKESPNEPQLTSLVVYASGGGVGDGFGKVMEDETDGVPQDLDDRAALERLRCYRYWEATDLPADGGMPAPSPATAARLARERERARRSAPRPRCRQCGGWKPLAADLCEDCTQD